MAMLNAQRDAGAKADEQIKDALDQALALFPEKTCECDECRTGDCCRIPVLVTPLDVMPIAWHIHTSGNNTARLRRRYLEQGERVLANLCKADRDPPPVPCVLLQDDNTCGHYERRPLACRIHYVLNGADSCRPYSCRDDKRRPMVDLLDAGDLSVFAVYLAQGAMKACGCMDAHEYSWMQPLPTQIAVLLRALNLPPSHFVYFIAEHCSLETETLEKIFRAQQTCRKALLEENGLEPCADWANP
jgi:hypothetical protein